MGSDPLVTDPHGAQPVLEAGPPLADARAAVILVHGRGASAQGILSLADALARPDVAFRAPQAAGGTWYPESFLAPLARNEPFLTSGLELVSRVVGRIEEAGFPSRKTVLLGFSQGACLALEHAARFPRRYGGVIALSGALIGTHDVPGAAPPDDKEFRYDRGLNGTPVFIGSSDPDAHIPVDRVHRSTEVLGSVGAEVTERIYRGAPHAVNEDELDFVRALLTRIAGG